MTFHRECNVGWATVDGRWRSLWVAQTSQDFLLINASYLLDPIILWRTRVEDPCCNFRSLCDENADWNAERQVDNGEEIVSILQIVTLIVD